jgi:hypothetical protein
LPHDQGVADNSVASHAIRLARRAFLHAARRKMHELSAIAAALFLNVSLLSYSLVLAWDRLSQYWHDLCFL